MPSPEPGQATTSDGDLTVQDRSARWVEDQMDTLAGLYATVFAEPPYNEGPADVERFVSSLVSHLRQPGFRLLTAHTATELVAFAYGLTLPPDTGWWAGALSPMPPELTAEWEGRTFAVIELAVERPRRRRGIGRHLHDGLIDGRTEERATLLVRPEAASARAAYSAWGWRQVGRIRPFDEAPVYDAMIRPLR